MRGSYRLFVRTVVAMVLIGGSSALAGIIAPVSRSSSVHGEIFSRAMSDPVGGFSGIKDDAYTGLGTYEGDAYIGSPSSSSYTYRAYQHSAILEDGVMALLSVRGSKEGSEFGYTGAESKFEFVFDVTSPASYELLGSCTSTIPRILVDLDFWHAFGQVSLKGPGVDINRTDKLDAVWDYRGTLDPGTYTLTMSAYTQEYFGASLTFAGSLSVTPLDGSTSVPEPASLSILGIGCALLVRRVR